jgi:glycosyltransferase involved in cell wall biosynthesis
MENKKPLVSIVTITFNLVKYKREKYFQQCIDSVKNQTYDNFEHIVIDGGSKDGTLDLIKKYADQGLINYISEPDKGIYDAMNKGIKMAKGKYVAFLNSDDYWHDKEAISESVKFLEKENADFSYAPARLQLEDGEFYHEHFGWKHQYYEPKISTIFFSMAFCHQTMFTKRDVMIKESMFDTNFKRSSDYDFIIRLCLKKYKSVFVDKQFTTFRLGGLSEIDSTLSYNEVSESYFKNFTKLVDLNKEECSKIFGRGFQGIPLKLAEKLKDFSPYFDFKEYEESFKLKNRIKNGLKVFSRKVSFIIKSISRNLFNFFPVKNLSIWLVIAILFSFLQIQHSLNRGQLSLPPSYDDVAYFNDSLIRLNHFYESGFRGLTLDFVNRPPHSFTSTFLAFTGFAIFGIKDWVPSFMNFVIVFAVLVFLDYLTRNLILRWKIFVALVSLTFLIMGHSIIEFRPDIFCGMITAMTIILIAEKSWLKSSSVKKAIVGLLFGLALIIKPTVFPVTIILVFFALFVNIIISKKFIDKEKLNLREIIFKSYEFVFFGLVISLPYYIFELKDAITYIYQNQFVNLEKVWGMHSLPFVEKISYYLVGQGGKMMIKDWIYLWLILVLVTTFLALYKKYYVKFIEKISLVSTFFVAYLIVTVSNHKSAFLGVIVACFILLTSMQMLVFLLQEINKVSNNLKKLSFSLVLISVFLFYPLYLFEWPADNDLFSPNPKTQAEKIYYNELLVRIFNDIKDEHDKKDLKKNNLQERIYLSSMAHWLHRDSMFYYQIKLFKEELFLFNDGALKDDFDVKVEEINGSDYILVFSTPSKDTPDWLPSVRIEPKIIEFLNNSKDFKLVKTYTNPYTNAEVFLYSKF